MRWLTLVVFSAAVAGLGFFGWGSLRGAPLEAASTNGQDSDALNCTRPACIAADGIVEAAHREVALRFEVPGRIKAVYVREGQTVKSGDMLAELDGELAREHLVEAQTRLKIAQAQRDQLLAESTRLADGRPTQRYPSRAEAAESLVNDQARTIADGEVALAEAALRREQLLVDRGRLLAPYDGLVLRVAAESGDSTGPTDDRELFVMVDGPACRVRAFVEELDGLRVFPGQRVLVSAAASPGKRHRGTVSACSPYFRVKSQRQLKPGERVDVRVREVVLDLEAGHGLLIGLPVEVFLEPPVEHPATIR